MLRVSNRKQVVSYIPTTSPMHKQFKWAIVVQKEGVECRLGTKKIEKKILMFANQNVELC